MFSTAIAAGALLCQFAVDAQPSAASAHCFTSLLLGTYTSAVIPGTNCSSGLWNQQLDLHRLDVALAPAVDVALRGEVGQRDLAITLPCTVAPLGITTCRLSPSCTASACVSGKRRVHPGLRQVHHRGDGAARSQHFALARRQHIHPAGDRRKHLRIAQLDTLPDRPAPSHSAQCPRVDATVRAETCASSSCACACCSAACAAATFALRRLHRRLRRLQAGHGFVAGLLARDALLGQRHGARGVGFLMLEVRLGLRQRRLRSLSPALRH